MQKLIEELILKNIFNLSQQKENVVGIWWYQIRTGILEYSSKAKGHLDREYFSLVDLAKTDKSIVRGRIIKIKNVIYCVLFTSNLTKLQINILLDLKNKLVETMGIGIDFIVDDEGNLLENKK